MMAHYIFRLYSGLILLYFTVTMVTVQAFWSAFDFVSVGNSKSGIVVTQLKITRADKTTYGISGTVDFTADLNDDYDCELKAYLSAQGNSKYTLLPYKVPRDACCKHLESAHWKGVENSLKNCSNMPPRKADEKFCFSLKKGEYEMRNFGFNYYVVPRHMDQGTYKIEIIMYETGSPDISSIATFVAKLY